MKCVARNWAGQTITKDNAYILRKDSFGKKDESGKIVVDWERCTPAFADGEGFDLRHKEENGLHRMLIQLPIGTELIRYGSPGGSYTAPKGTQFEELSLPHERDSLEYNEYRVIADGVLVQVCQAERGKVAPMFEMPGGGVQYYHGEESVQDLLDQNKLERIELWKDCSS